MSLHRLFHFGTGSAAVTFVVSQGPHIVIQLGFSYHTARNGWKVLVQCTAVTISS